MWDHRADHRQGSHAGCSEVLAAGQRSPWAQVGMVARDTESHCHVFAREWESSVRGGGRAALPGEEVVLGGGWAAGRKQEGQAPPGVVPTSGWGHSVAGEAPLPERHLLRT